MRYLIAAAAALLLAGPAWATGTWDKNCASGFTGAVLGAGTVLGTSTNKSTRIGPGDLGCYRFTDLSTGASCAGATCFSSEQTPAEGDGDIVIQVTAESALWVFTPDLTAPTTVAGTGRVKIRYCTSGTPLQDRDNPDDECASFGELTGVEAGGTSQALRTGPGVYVIEISGDCPADQTCQVSVRGEGVDN